jgi:hypothetical protein
MASARNFHTPSIQTAVRGSIGSTASLFFRAFCVAIEFGVLSEVVLNVRSWMVDVNKDCLAVNKIVAVEH